MDTETGPTEHPLIEALLREGHRFSFFQAVSLLERSKDGVVSVGGTGPAAQELLRFRPDVSLGFPPGSVSEIERLESADVETSGFSMAKGGDERYRITSTLMGLYGTNSPLPNHWAEEILFEYQHDTTARDFLDIFHHRLYSLFYRSWTKYRFHVQYRLDSDDRFTPRLFALLGLMPDAVRRSVGLPAERLLRYTGLLVQRPRSGAGLAALLSDWFDLPVTVEPCRGRYVDVFGADLLRLGTGACTLGTDALLGSRVFDVSGQFKVRLGPMDYASYCRFLPDGPDHALFRSLVRLFVTDHLDAEMELILKGDEVPPLDLDPEEPHRLGWNSWLRGESSPDVGTVFSMREN